MGNKPAVEPLIIEFGPCRTIGIRYAGKNENNEIPQVWDKQLIPRMGEIRTPPNGGAAFGICRCIPGATDGSFEYIAAVETAPEAPVPAGMVAVDIPACQYAAFPVESLEQIKTVWEGTGAWFEANPGFEPFCGPNGCDCANHPGFEYYPPNWDMGSLFVYLPVADKRRPQDAAQ